MQRTHELAVVVAGVVDVASGVGGGAVATIGASGFVFDLYDYQTAYRYAKNGT